MKLFRIFLLSAVVTATACSNPFALKTLNSDEKAVIEKISMSDFSSSSITADENANLLSAARKFMADSQPKFSETLLNALNRSILTKPDDLMNYYYLMANIAASKNDIGSAYKNIYAARDYCRKIIADNNTPDGARKYASLFLADMCSFSAALSRSMGRYDEALEAAGAASEIYNTSNEDSLKQKAIQSFILESEMKTRLGKLKEASETLSKAENIISGISPGENIQWRRLIAGYFHSLILLKISMNDRSDIEQLFDKAEKNADQLKDKSELVKIWLLHADEIAGRSDVTDAEKNRLVYITLAVAYEYCGKSSDRLLRAVTSHRLALVVDSLGVKGEYDGLKSIDLLKKSLDDFSILNNTFNSNAEYSHYFNMLVKSYERYIDLLVDNGNYDDALFYVEKIRARKLRSFVLQKKMNPESLLNPDLKKEIEDKQQYRDWLLRQYMKLKTDYFVSAEDITRIESKIKYTDKEIESARERAESLSIGYRLVTQNPVSQKDVSSLLDDDQAVIVFHLKDNNIAYRWVITKDETAFKKINLDCSIQGLADEMRSGVGIGNYSNKADENGYFLYNRLFKDIAESKNPKKRWIILPHANMSLIPFDALVTGFDSAKKPAYLIDKGFIISLTPSLTVFVMKRNGQTRTYEKDLISFSDPDYAGNATQLEDSLVESRGIASLFKKSDQFERGSATESRFKTMDLTKYRYIHISTHGSYLSPNMNNEPFVLMSLASDPGNDGFLFAREVYALTIPAEIVSISACFTAVGSADPYEGIVGFTHAFFTAGTKGVVLSLWALNSRSAGMLYQEFYKQIAGGVKPDIALYNAKVIVRKKYPSPYHWAPVIYEM